MRKILTRMTHWGAAIVVLSQTSVRAAESSPPSEPVVSVAAASPTVGTAVEGLIEVAPVTRTRPLFQHTTYPAAWRAAQKSNRPILVFVSMPNCHYCVKMSQQVYHYNPVKQLVSNSFETIKVGRYSHAELVQKLRIKWYPTTVVVGPNNKILDVIEGYADASSFQRRLQTGLASLNKPATTTTR